MTKAKDLRHVYEANMACGDIGKIGEARMLAQVAGAEIEEVRAFLRDFEERAAQAT